MIPQILLLTMAEDKPICPGLKNGVTSFEELIEMKMKQSLDVDGNIDPPMSPGSLSKKQFLKRGDGLNRWIGKGGTSPTSEQPTTPQPNKNPNIKRKIFSGTKESATKAAPAHNAAPRVPSHVIPPKSPKHIGQAQSVTKLPAKLPIPHVSVPNRRKNSPVPASPRLLVHDSDSKLGSKAAPLPRARSPASFVQPVIAPMLEPESSFNRVTDMTLCSEKEFEQLEEYLGDHPHDSSICSQASVVRKFMSRPSLKPLKPETSPLTNDLAEANIPQKDISSGIPQLKIDTFKDDESWSSDINTKSVLPETIVIPEPVIPIINHHVVEVADTPKRQTAKVETETEKTAIAEKSSAPVAPSGPDPLQPLNDVLRTKILQLDVEIEKFRTENRRLEEKKREFEKVQADFIAEKRKYDELMESETAKFEQFKRQELSKIKRERAALDQLRTQVHTLASEKNSVELVQLRERLRRSESEAAEKEDRLNQALNRAKDQIKRLHAENEELKRSMEMLERLRIDRNASETASKSLKQKAAGDSAANKNAAPLSSRKPLPLKGDARQNCIPQGNNALPSENGSNRLSLGKNDFASAAVVSAEKLVSNQSDKEDESASSPVSTETAPVAFAASGPAVVGNDDTLQGADDEADEEDDAVAPSLDPSQAAIMNQWLKDLGFSLIEDEEACQASLVKEFPDGKVEVTRSDGSRRINFANGTIKVTGTNGLPVFIKFFNNDMKKVTADSTIYYYYADSQTVQISFPDGLEVMEFSNGQVEKKYPNGAQDVVFPDGTVKQTYPDGVEVCTFVDGSVVTTSANGDRIVEFPNGQREVHTSECRSRIYPNGIVRVVYKSGLCETRYPNGEVRRKVIRETATKDGAVSSSASVSTTLSSQPELPSSTATANP